MRIVYLHLAVFQILMICSVSCAQRELAVGFEAADSDQSEFISADELKTYLYDRLQDESLRHDEIFERIDANNDRKISRSEFANRHEAIEETMGPRFEIDLGDPGKDFVPWRGVRHPTNDSKIMAAVIHRFQEVAKDESFKWAEGIDLSKVPESIGKSMPRVEPASKRPKTEDLVRATVILCGGSGMGFFTSGGVIISDDGLVMTNYHVAEFLSEGKMAAMTTDGKCHPVVEFVAGNRDRDAALIRIQGDNFVHVDIATEEIPVGADLEMIHHSENRFFTYDRGYVMRYPTLGSWPWMEISADYAPGASGCGIFNEKRELVGLVSIIQYGDGPTLALEFDMDAEESSGPVQDAGVNEEMDGMDSMLLVKHAVPLSAIRSLWKADSVLSNQKRATRMRKAIRELEPKGQN